MVDYPYTNVTNKLTEFLERTRSIGVPDKATTSWLASLGYKSKNDRSFIHVLEFIGFIDSTGTPTQKWLDFRGNDYKKVLGNALREAYSELFKVYPDANMSTSDELWHFFSTKNKSGEQVISRIINTFKTLCEMASFDNLSEILQEEVIPSPSENKSQETAKTSQMNRNNESLEATDVTPSIHIDLQIHISPDSSPDQIDRIFESMAKNIFKR